jgi:hypothetical protein
VPGASRLAFLTGAVAAVLALAVVTVLPRFGGEEPAAKASNVPVHWQRPVVSADDLVNRVGVRLTHVALTGGGGLIDLRFQVVDPDRAAAIHNRATPPAVVDESSGLLINQLLMNHAHSGRFKPAVTYYLIFESPGNWIHRGSRVTVLLGNAQVEHVVVV